jgi:hypothetical protein
MRLSTEEAGRWEGSHNPKILQLSHTATVGRRSSMGSEVSHEAGSGSGDGQSTGDSLSLSQHRDQEVLSHSSSAGDVIRQRNERIRAMDEQIRSRVRHGIQYNLKFIVRGSKQSGKTTLWNRLQGFKFLPEVTSTTSSLALIVSPWSSVCGNPRNSSEKSLPSLF